MGVSKKQEAQLAIFFWLELAYFSLQSHDFFLPMTLSLSPNYTNANDYGYTHLYICTQLLHSMNSVVTEFKLKCLHTAIYSKKM
jgi:hypothetical protein